MRIGDDFDFLSHVIEDEERIGQEEGEVGQIEVIFPAARQFLKRPDDVITQVADGAADEPRALSGRSRSSRPFSSQLDFA